MTEPAKPRRSWISLGELIALAALVISALGLWLSYQSNQKDGPTRVVEQKQTIPLILRGSVSDDGRTLTIAPVESAHALESLTIAIQGAEPITLGSDGRLSADDLQQALKDRKDEKGSQSVRARLTTRYVEMGRERGASGTYAIRYQWSGGGLFESRSLQIEGMSRR